MHYIPSSRREFLRLGTLGSLGFALGVKAWGLDNRPVLLDATAIELELNPFVIIGTEGRISLVNPRPDMGQGSTQAVPALLAEELEVALEQVTLLQSDGQAKYGSQLSGGSSSVRSLWLPLRKAGAAAREMLRQAAANRWGVALEVCYAKEGRIYQRDSDRSFTYGELVAAAAALPVPANPPLKDPRDFKLLGKFHPRLDVPSRVTGQAVYGLDVTVPDMVYAAILHAPAIHSKIKNIDAAAALRIPGVLQVLPAERPMPHRTAEAVAVVASNWWAALKGKKALQVTWDHGDLPQTLTTADYFARCYAAAAQPGINYEEKGDVGVALTTATTIEAVYETPFLAHAPLEPENAIVQVLPDGSVEVWAPVQGPDGARDEVARYFGIAPERVKVNVSLLGGAFGRKAYHDFLLEACFLAKKLSRPVKVIWTREDDITQGPYRPGMLSALRGGVKGNKILAMHHHAIGESIKGQVFKALGDNEVDDWIAEELSQENHQYRLPNWKLSWTNVKTDIPIVWWRSVYASNFAFGQECFLDELAHAAKLDPLTARLQLLQDTRFRQVLETLREKSQWTQPLSPDQGRGIAIFKSFGSISACCVVVQRHPAGGVKVVRVISVLDCGLYVNPDNVKAQTEGNIVMGLTAATHAGITFAEGQAQQSNFHNYPIMRLADAPVMEIHLVDSGAAPGGVGEPGLPPVAPALANAVFALTGRRWRKLPINLSEA